MCVITKKSTLTDDLGTVKSLDERTADEIAEVVNDDDADHSSDNDNTSVL